MQQYDNLDNPDIANEIDSEDKEYLPEPQEMTKWTFFKAGWRPALGWLSVIIIFYSFIVHPALVWYVLWTGSKMAVPMIDSGALLNLVAIVIGVGAMRTYEKMNYSDQPYRPSRRPQRRPSRFQNEDDIYN